MVKHICGQCNKSFKSETSYLKHLCSITGYTPKQPEHFQPLSYTIYPPTSTPASKTQNLSESANLAKVAAARRDEKQYNANF